MPQGNRRVAVAVLAFVLPAALAAAQGDLAAQAQALLAQRCLDCHGAAKQKGNLRLDSQAAALAGGASGAAVVPGDAAHSLLVRAVRREAEPAMPPRQPLPAAEIAVLERWVAAGLPLPGAPAVAATAKPARPGAAAPAPTFSDGLFFEREVRPILAEHCFECHGSNQPTAGLDLTSRATLLAGGRHGPAAVPGKPAASLLLKALRHQGGLAMPKRAAALPAAQIAVIERWIARGLPWPEAAREVDIVSAPGQPFAITPAQRGWWSFVPPRDPPPPAVRDQGWARDPIDRFVLARLEAAGLAPAPAADPATLLRRVHLDLVGLPPTPEEVDAFLADPSPAAFAATVDALLTSPRYGERWGRHWLDVARYADAVHYDPKYSRFPAYLALYRDWVIAAVNADLPYDAFLTHQLAGDLLPESTGAAVATGLLALGNWSDNDTQREKVRTDIVDDQIDVVGRGMLGLTLACARCHHHKFDPIASEDYYALAGIFHSTSIVDATHARLRRRVPGSSDAVARRFDAFEKAVIGGAGDAATAAAAERELAAMLGELRDAALPYAYIARDGGIAGGLHDGFGDCRVHIRGDWRRQGALVPRGFPQVLGGATRPSIPAGSSGRLELARWLTRPDHPLTARVLVNRVWQHHFGAGLVRTPDDFGKLGEPPTHPELLDHLARRFVAGGWSIKALHRAILSTATWQQASVPRPEALARDPDNRLLARMTRRRLDAEGVRDGLLAVAGRLRTAERAPAPWPGQRPDVRTVFLHLSRFATDPFWTIFDGADPAAITGRRDSSIVPQQALFLLNGELATACAAAAARRACPPGATAGDAAALRRLHLLLLGRPPGDDDLRQAQRFLGAATGAERDAAWARYAHALLCSNAFLFID